MAVTGIALRSFFRRVSPAGIEPVGFRTKSDLRNHQAIIQPRLYDCLMVTQITLKTESPHGLLSGPDRRRVRSEAPAWAAGPASNLAQPEAHESKVTRTVLTVLSVPASVECPASGRLPALSAQLGRLQFEPKAERRKPNAGSQARFPKPGPGPGSCRQLSRATVGKP